MIVEILGSTKNNIKINKTIITDCEITSNKGLIPFPTTKLTSSKIFFPISELLRLKNQIYGW